MASKKQRRRFIRNKRRILLRLPFLKKTLAPRGQRGDIAMIPSDYEEDEIWFVNRDNTFEELTEADAKEIWNKQTNNISPGQTNPALAALRSENGNEYDQVQVRTREEQVYKVAEVGKDQKGTSTVIRPDDAGFQEAAQRDVNMPREAKPGSAEAPIQDRKEADYLESLRQNTSIGHGARGEK